MGPNVAIGSRKEAHDWPGSMTADVHGAVFDDVTMR